MLIAFSIFSLLVLCFIAAYLRIRGVRLAYIWTLFFLILAFVLLLIVLVDPGNLQPFSTGGFSGPGNEFIAFTFRLTNENRIVGICLFILVLAFLATETASPQGNISLSRWVQVLIFTSAAWAVLLSANAWTVLISWTILDVLDVTSQLIFRRIRTGQFLAYYLSKFAGSFVLVLVISLTNQPSLEKLYGGLLPNIGFWMLLAVFLHSGIFLQAQISEETKQHDNPTQLIRIISFLPHFFFLTQIPEAGVTPLLRIALQILMFIGASITAIRWFVNTRTTNGFHQIIVCLAFISAFLFISENQRGLIFFLLTLLPMSWIILADDRSSLLTPLWIVGALMLVGLPFTPQYAAYEDLILRNKIAESAVMVLPTTLIMSGVFQYLRKPGGDINRLEKFNQTFYIIGLTLPLVGVILGLWTYRPLFNLGDFWFGALHIFLFVGFNYIANHSEYLLPRFKIKGIVLRHFPELSRRLNIILLVIIEIAGAGLSYGARLLEEEGGVLWAMVFLSLLLTILTSVEGFS